MPVKHLKIDKLRVAGHGVGNTRTRRRDTAKPAPNISIFLCHVPVLPRAHTHTLVYLYSIITHIYLITGLLPTNVEGVTSDRANS